MYLFCSPLGVYADGHQMQENQTVADAQTEQEKEYTRTLRSVSIKDLVDRNFRRQEFMKGLQKYWLIHKNMHEISTIL